MAVDSTFSADKFSSTMASVAGIELSDVSQTTCKDLHKQGLVIQGPLNDIPHPDSSFDLVFTSEVR